MMLDGKLKDSGLSESMVRVSQMQTDAVMELAAYFAVSRTLLIAMIRCLSPASLAELESVFREKIEDVLAKTDDRAMPGEFDRAFFNEVNSYLRAMAAR